MTIQATQVMIDDWSNGHLAWQNNMDLTDSREKTHKKRGFEQRLEPSSMG